LLEQVAPAWALCFELLCALMEQVLARQAWAQAARVWLRVLLLAWVPADDLHDAEQRQADALDVGVPRTIVRGVAVWPFCG